MTNQQPRMVNADMLIDALQDAHQLRLNINNLIQNSLEPAYCLVVLNPVNGEPHAYWNTSSPVPADYILSRGLELLRAVSQVQATPTKTNQREVHTDARGSNTITPGPVHTDVSGSSEQISEQDGEVTEERILNPIEDFPYIKFTSPADDRNLIDDILEGRD